jgi:spore coat polysaccharide biosynthesis protein SpsF (cytidylyltransferase family)
MKKCAVYNLKNDRLQGKVLEPLISQEYINKLTIINKIKNQPYKRYIIVNFKIRETDSDTYINNNNKKKSTIKFKYLNILNGNKN